MSYSLHLNEIQTQLLIKEYYNNLETPTNNYTLFRANCNGSFITIYKTNTVLIQGKNEQALYEEICKLLNIDANIEKSTNDRVFDALSSTIGTDEVGTGDFFGGIVVAGAFVKKDDILEIRKLGVKDSKEIDDAKILELAPILMQKIPYKVLLLEDLKYNYLVFKSKYNMNHIKALMHNHVILQMKNKITDYDSIIIDAFTTKPNYFNYLQNEKNVCEEVNLIEKAENKFISVACASIIARYTFLKHMDDLSNKVGFELPKGAGKVVDSAISMIYTEKGISIFKEISKLNFKNFNKYRINN